MSEKKDEKSNEKESIKALNQTANVSGSAEKMIPKTCNSIGISLLKNQSMILTMVYNEPPGNVAHLIDRVSIDLEHAESLSRTLTKILEDIKNGTTKFE